MGSTLETEDASMAGARRGDPLAWADLYERYHPVLERYLEVVNPAAASDMDSLWERAGRSLGGQPEGIDPLVWLLRVARDGRVECPSPHTSDDPAVAAIRSLTPAQMDVVALRVVAGLDERDAAAVIGRPVERVRALGHQGLAVLMREQELV